MSSEKTVVVDPSAITSEERGRLRVIVGGGRAYGSDAGELRPPKRQRPIVIESHAFLNGRMLAFAIGGGIVGFGLGIAFAWLVFRST